MILAFFLLVTLALETVALGWSIALNAQQAIVILILRVFVAVYVVSLATRAIQFDTAPAHSDSMIHLSALTFIAFAPLAISAIVPDDSIKIYADFGDRTIDGLNYAVAAFYGLSCALAITTPLGPALHYPKELIYSEKVVAAITNQAYDNVCGVTGM